MRSINAKEERVLSLLRLYGLKEYEGKAYFTLLVLGKAKAGLIAKRSGVPQSKVYGTLYDLADKGLTTIVASSPKEFEACGIERLVKTFVKSRRFEIYKAAKNSEELKRIAETMSEAMTNPLLLPIRVFEPKYRYRRVGV